MKLEEMVTSIELSLRLEALGVKQRQTFQHHWLRERSPFGSWGEWSFEYYTWRLTGKNRENVRAYTAQELGEILLEEGYYFSLDTQSEEWGVDVKYSCYAENKDRRSFISEAGTMAEALGLLLIQILEEYK